MNAPINSLVTAAIQDVDKSSHEDLSTEISGGFPFLQVNLIFSIEDKFTRKQRNLVTSLFNTLDVILRVHEMGQVNQILAGANGVCLAEISTSEEEDVVNDMVKSLIDAFRVHEGEGFFSNGDDANYEARVARFYADVESFKAEVGLGKKEAA